MSSLKPCPFCGGQAEIERYGDSRKSTIYQCTVCSCSLETGEEWGHGNDWNRRETDAQPETLAWGIVQWNGEIIAGGFKDEAHAGRFLTHGERVVRVAIRVVDGEADAGKGKTE